MGKIDVVMPQMGESIAEGTLSKWLKKVGDAVRRDEPIFEISTDKVDAEIPAPSAGVLAEILVQEGQTVPVQTVVARLETAAATGAPPIAAPPPSKSEAPPPAPTPPPPTPTHQPPVAAAPARPAPPHSPSPPKAAETPASPVSPGAGPPEPAQLEDRLRTKSTPLVRKIAAEHNIDLSAIRGSGLAGRVTKSDVLSHLEAPQPARPSGSPPPPAPDAAPSPSPPHPPPSPVAELIVGAGARVIPGPVVEPWEGDRVEPWSRIRKLTADHMVMSRRVSAHVQSLIEVDYSRIAALRAQWKAEFTERGVALTYLGFVAAAVARSLRRHPVLNAAVMGESTIYRGEINLGIAVAMDWGLIVPVIRHADELNLLGIARAIADLAERARTKRLSPDEVQKGTFTITNPGVFGTFVGLPVLNQPQSAILAVGAIGKRPAVLTGPDGTDTIGIRTLGMLALSFDHRIVDGADADRFLADLRAQLEQDPEQLA